MTAEEWLGPDNQLGLDIWEKKYRAANESFDQWVARVSGGDPRVAKLILQKKFLFGGRILAGRGLARSGKKTTLSNCYVLGVEDSIESIFEAARDLARTYSYGGGCGIDISALAPEGAKVNNAANASSGAVSFMDLFSLVTGLIAQNGRRGAMMISMSCEHPDIESFIDVKQDLSRVTKANTSVRMTDAFMQAAEANREVLLTFTRPETGEILSRRVNAGRVLDKLAFNNWDMGEPGVLFWDAVERGGLLSEYPDFHYAGVNPCAEEPLPLGGSCLLGSLNLAAFVENGSFNFDAFAQAVRVGVEALNQVLDEGILLHPLAIQRTCARDWRQIGLGIMGLADMLAELGIPYGSSQSLELCEGIAGAMAREAIQASLDLGREKGPFPKCDPTLTANSPFFRAHSTSASAPLRNSQLLTIAPTGSLSSMLGISGGIEPIFANSYTRKTESLHGEDVYYKVYTPVVARYMQAHGIREEKDLPPWFVTAQQVDTRRRIAMQAVWQKHIDASISSTVNLPQEATPQQVREVYLSAWKAGLKGITVFRSGCRRTAILSSGDAAPAPGVQETAVQEAAVKETAAKETAVPWDRLPRGYVIQTEDGLAGKKRKLTTGCGTLHCQAYFDPDTGALMETFLDKGSSGGCVCNLCAISRLMSLCARSGVPISAILDQLRSVQPCVSYTSRTVTSHDTSKGTSCPSAIAYALESMCQEARQQWGDEEDPAPAPLPVPREKAPGAPPDPPWEPCPACGQPLVHEGGCTTCKACGWSRCE